MADLADKVVELSIAMFFISSIFVSALVSLATATYTSVDPTVKTLITVFVPTIAGLTVAYAIYRELKHSKSE